MVKYMLSTKDNPYSPVDNFTQWLIFDSLKGYNSCEYLARVVNITDNMTEEEEALETNRAIDEIIDKDFMDVYIKVPYEEDLIADMMDVIEE